MTDSVDFRNYATYRHFTGRLESNWTRFLDRRTDRLRHGGETEKVAEAILEDLFTEVLDWSKGDLTYQIGYADIVLSKNLAKFLVIEVKRPGTLWPGRPQMLAAIEQARRYADQQQVLRIAASDGRYFYAADIDSGVTKDRIIVDLARKELPLSLWWVSEHGIWRDCGESCSWPIEEVAPDTAATFAVPSQFLHPTYERPARCFAYVGDANNYHTWKLPYLQSDGTVDARRLPKAIQSLLSNFRGVKVQGIPESAIAEVLTTLARAADKIGRMPPKASNPAPIYRELAQVLKQIGISIE